MYGLEKKKLHEDSSCPVKWSDRDDVQQPLHIKLLKNLLRHILLSLLKEKNVVWLFFT